MSVHELALQRAKYKHLSDDEWRWFLQQVEGRERTADKLPSFASIEDWWYPVRLSCEQCSSELTARYKAKIVNGKCPNGKCLDLTGGYGVDTLFLSKLFDRTDYVEQNAELCRIMAHNKELFKSPNIAIHNCTAEEFLSSPLHGAGEELRSIGLPVAVRRTNKGGYSLIFIDPARRDAHGGKVFKLADCTPNVIDLLPAMMEHLTPSGQIMLKLSPMLDISQALKELSTPCTFLPPSTGQVKSFARSDCQWPSVEQIRGASPLSWSVHVVAVKNEVKEVILCTKGPSTMYEGGRITAIDLAEPEKLFTFTREEESNSEAVFQRSGLSSNSEAVYLYEPDTAILKAGAYKLVSARFGLTKLDVNTHLYMSDQFIPAFPGRIFQTLPDKQDLAAGSKANVLVRNYPMTAEQLKKKLRLKDGGENYLIACRVNGKPTLFHAKRV